MRNLNLNSVSTDNQHEILNKFGNCLFISYFLKKDCNLYYLCDHAHSVSESLQMKKYYVYIWYINNVLRDYKGFIFESHSP